VSGALIDAIRQFGGDPADAPFWEACKSGRFLLHRCGVCARCYWPASRCVDHGDGDMRWVDSSGQGELYTYTIMHHAYDARLAAKTPYVVGVIKLDEGPYFHSNVVGCALEDVGVGMRLEAHMIEHESGLTIPVFSPLSR
jgi:uncharacterized OB-fold protein